jgi:hypothetical protein
MPTQLQLRKVLPISQTLLAVAFGGWGLWERITSINDSWLGWNSTLRFHVWPWPFKFAVVQNIPAFLIGLLLSWPIDSFKPGLPEWVSLLPSLLLVPLLWYLIGAWLDRKRVLGRTSGETVVLISGIDWMVLHRPVELARLTGHRRFRRWSRVRPGSTLSQVCKAQSNSFLLKIVSHGIMVYEE